MDKNVINIIKELLDNHKRIIILTHANPDGDAIGSSLALYSILIQEKHNVSIITPNEFPSFLAWMPYTNNILVHKNNKKKVSEAIKAADIIFCLDFNDVKRMEAIEEDYLKSGAVKIMIDHHISSDVYTDYSISNTYTSSTSELIYDLIADLNKAHLINKEVAECLYVGIVTDTGSFSYACNYEKTYLIIAELFKHGIDGEHIHRLVYDTYTEDRMRLLGYCLSEKLRVFPKYHTAYISLTKEDMNKFNYKIGDTEGIVNYGLSIESIDLAALFMERDGCIKISLRSKGGVSVNDIARKYYSGGGHHNAAGGNSYISMEKTLAEFEAILPVIFSNK